MAVTVGGEAFGILGMLFSVPVCAVLYNLYLAFMKTRLPVKDSLYAVLKPLLRFHRPTHLG